MEKDVYIALGLMSGTSLDGVDVAIIETDGEDIFGFIDSAEMPYADFEREVLEDAVRDALDWGFDNSRSWPNSFASAEAVINSSHFCALRLVQEESCVRGRRVYPTLSIIGFHGQTVLHQPAIDGAKGQTLQLGDGQAFADKTVTRVAYDFRSEDVSAGGQGAPLAPIYHEALVRYSKLDGKIAVINIGGVSNVTFIEDGKLVGATDCGPGNGPLDSWVALHNHGRYDVDGRLSFAGKVGHKNINQWLKGDFFMRSIPRSADRYDFDVLEDMTNMSLEDGAATLASFCAQAIARDLSKFDAKAVIICGGGRKNPTIMTMLDMHIDADILSAEDVGWDGDMLEAQAFAYLAVRTWKRLPISFPETTGAPRPLTGGQIAFPRDRFFDVHDGREKPEFKEPDWSLVEAKLKRKVVDLDVLRAMSYDPDEVPGDVDFTSLYALYVPLSQDHTSKMMEESKKVWVDKFGNKDLDQFWLDKLGLN